MNNYLIKTTGEFDESLNNYIQHLNLLSLNIANNFYQELLLKLELLGIFPRMYPIYKRKSEIRKFKVKKCIILYRIEFNIIYIIDIIHVKSKKINNQD